MTYGDALTQAEKLIRRSRKNPRPDVYIVWHDIRVRAVKGEPYNPNFAYNTTLEAPAQVKGVYWKCRVYRQNRSIKVKPLH